MKALGVGWLMQDAMYFGGEAFRRERGDDAIKRTPPIRTALNIGVRIGAGTDAHRVDVVQSVRGAAMDGRRQDRRRQSDPRRR